MVMSDFWNEDEENAMSEAEAERILAQQNQAASKPKTRAPAPIVEEDYSDEVEEMIEEMVESEEDSDDAETMRNARLRLEQGRLYEMLMDHSLFEGVDADSRAVKFVEKRIKNFIKEQLEILLGIRAEKENKTVEMPFTETEISLLKGLVARVMEKQGIEPDAPIVKKSEPQKMTPRPLKLSSSVSTQKPVAKKVAPQQPQPKQAKAPITVNQQKQKPVVEKPLEKSPYEMTPEELTERNSQIAKKYQAAGKSSGQKLDADQKVIHYSKMLRQRDPSNTMNMLLSKLGASNAVDNVGDGDN